MRTKFVWNKVVRDGVFARPGLGEARPHAAPRFSARFTPCHSDRSRSVSDGGAEEPASRVRHPKTYLLGHTTHRTGISGHRHRFGISPLPRIFGGQVSRHQVSRYISNIPWLFGP